MAFRMPLSRRFKFKSHSALGSMYDITAVSTTDAIAAGHATSNKNTLKRPNPAVAIAFSKSAGVLASSSDWAVWWPLSTKKEKQKIVI